MATIYVKPVHFDRSVALSEGHPDHPNGEAWVVGYPGQEDAAAVQVGDTPYVRQQIARGFLVQAQAPKASAKTKAEQEAEAAAGANAGT